MVLEAIANPKIADPVGSFQQGRENRRQRMSREMVGDILSNTTGGKIGALAKIDPQVAMGLSEALGIPMGEDARLKSEVGDIKIASHLLKSGVDPQQVAQFLGEKTAMLGELGIKPTQYMEYVQRLKNGDETAVQELIQLGDAFDSSGMFGANKQSKSSEQRGFESLVEGLDPEDRKRAIRIKLGLDPRAVGSSTQTITDKGTVSDVAETEEILSAAKESGKLQAEFNLKPRVSEAVELALGNARLAAKNAEENRSNAAAMNLYETAMNGLASSLEDTLSGPFVGFLPSVTASQQIADGAVAAMAPVLKQMFRASGEGTFTDRDQLLLLEMVPTRKDLPETRAAKIANIDAIVRAKLKQTEGNENTQPPSGRFQIEVVE